MDLVDILRRAFNEEGYIKGDEIAFFCPKHDHHKRKLCINLITQKCHCWICDLSARSIHSLFKKLKFDTSLLKNTHYHVEEIFEENKQQAQIVKLPDEFLPLCYKQKSIFYNQALAYLRSRNVEDLQILRNKIGYCESGEYRGRIIFPSFDSNGKLNYFVTRLFLSSESRQKHKNPTAERQNIIFNEQNIDFSKPITICEGIFDSFVCGRNSIPLLGSSVYENLIEKCVKQKCPEIFLVLDPDTYKFEDNNSKLVRICKKLLQYDLTVKFIDVRPYKDVGEMSKDEFISRRSSAMTVDDRFLFNIKMGEMNDYSTPC